MGFDNILEPYLLELGLRGCHLAKCCIEFFFPSFTTSSETRFG